MKKKHKTRLSAQTMCFFSITHPVYTQVFLRTLADVSVSDMFMASFPFLHIFIGYLLFYIAMGAHWPALRVVLSFKLGFASNSELDGDSLPAHHNESLANISCPLHMSAILPDISDNNVPYPICL